MMLKCLSGDAAVGSLLWVAFQEGRLTYHGQGRALAFWNLGNKFCIFPGLLTLSGVRQAGFLWTEKEQS